MRDAPLIGTRLLCGARRAVFLGQFQKADRWYRLLIDRHSSVEFLLEYAGLLLSLGRFHEAQERYLIAWEAAKELNSPTLRQQCCDGVSCTAEALGLSHIALQFQQFAIAAQLQVDRIDTRVLGKGPAAAAVSLNEADADSLSDVDDPSAADYCGEIPNSAFAQWEEAAQQACRSGNLDAALSQLKTAMAWAVQSARPHKIRFYSSLIRRMQRMQTIRNTSPTWN